MNVTSTTAVSCSVGSSSSESLPNDGEKPNHLKRFLFPICGNGKIFIKHAFGHYSSRSGIHKHISEGWSVTP